MRKAILSAGYSQSVANTPSNITNTKSWRELLDEQVPDTLLVTRLSKNIKSKQVSGSNTALDMAYKLKGKYAPTQVNINDPTAELSDVQLQAEIDKLEAQIKAKK